MKRGKSEATLGVGGVRHTYGNLETRTIMSVTILGSGDHVVWVYAKATTYGGPHPGHQPDHYIPGSQSRS